MVQNYSFPLIGKYEVSGKSLTPIKSDGTLKELRIHPSKHAGRPDYLTAHITGDYKPKFLSSVYEPRTKEGWFNFEWKGLRYEVVNEGAGSVSIYQYGNRREDSHE